jgi:hypothetical protein
MSDKAVAIFRAHAVNAWRNVADGRETAAQANAWRMRWSASMYRRGEATREEVKAAWESARNEVMMPAQVVEEEAPAKAPAQASDGPEAAEPVPDLAPSALAQREAWLDRAKTELGPLFAAQQYGIPAVRVTCGFPSSNARPGRKQTIGECWDGSQAEDGVAQIFISPVLRDSVRVLGVLVHELVHAVVGCEEGHKGAFAKLARALGLTGKPSWSG